MAAEFPLARHLRYSELMDQFSGSDHELPDALLDEEDEATLAAVDEGIRAADEGRLVPEDEVRRRMKLWNSEFSTQTRR